MDSKYEFIWTATGLVIDLTGGEEGHMFVPWERLEAFGVRVIREAGAYDQALVSRSAFGKRYNGED
jgi:hypothetical protein